jgi:hypothetical protein
MAWLRLKVAARITVARYSNWPVVDAPAGALERLL